MWASTLKAYFSNLPQPLLTEALYPEYIEAARAHPDPEQRADFVAALVRILRKLPPPYRITAAALIRHIQRVRKRHCVLCYHLKFLPPADRAVNVSRVRFAWLQVVQHPDNQMTAKNLAVCFTSTILSPAPPVDPTEMMAALQSAAYVAWHTCNVC